MPARLIAFLLIIAALAAAGCEASSDSDDKDSTSTATATSTTGGGTDNDLDPIKSTTTVGISVKDGKVEGGATSHEVTAGDQVTINIASDGESFHVHGFDDEGPINNGVGTLTLLLEEPGVYEIEQHHPDLPLGELKVTPA